jgi:uncharacterized protein YkwD
MILVGLAALVLLASGSLAQPASAYAVSDEKIEAKLLALINAARAERGVAPLHFGGKLEDFAGDRAAKMARTGVLKHPKCLPCKLDKRHIRYSAWGETIAWTYGSWSTEVAKSLFTIWKNSPPHWSILMSPSYDRIGIGITRRANGSIWAAAVPVG